MSERNELYHKILYFFFQDYIFGLPESERKKFVARGFFGKLKSILITIILSQKRKATTREVDKLRPVLTEKKWVFVFGKNNYEATKFLGDEGFVFVTDSKRKYHSQHDIILLPIRRKLRSFISFFSLVKHLKDVERKR